MDILLNIYIYLTHNYIRGSRMMLYHTHFPVIVSFTAAACLLCNSLKRLWSSHVCIIL